MKERSAADSFRLVHREHSKIVAGTQKHCCNTQAQATAHTPETHKNTHTHAHTHTHRTTLTPTHKNKINTQAFKWGVTGR